MAISSNWLKSLLLGVFVLVLVAINPRNVLRNSIWLNFGDTNTPGILNPIGNNFILKDPYQNRFPSVRLWIYITTWQEGMASWFISLSQAVVLAKQLNATLVEPCIRDGRLVSCAINDSLMTSNKKAIPLSHVVDLNRLLKYYEHGMASYQEFQRQTKTSNSVDSVQQETPLIADATTIPTFHVCMRGYSGTNCSDADTFPSYYKANSIPSLNEALNSTQTNSMTVLEVENYGKNGFLNLEWMRQPSAIHDVEWIQRDFLRVAPEHVTATAKLLKAMNIPSDQPFSVLHWRAELPDIDYIKCAQRIIEAREVMLKANEMIGNNETTPTSSPKHPFILMSSLNTNANFMWGGAKRMADSTNASSPSQQALRMLLQAGFHKLDQVMDYDHLEDPVLLAAYDVVIASKAQQFTSCTKACARSSICAACNWQGSFSAFAVNQRKYVMNKTSLECWPEL